MSRGSWKMLWKSLKIVWKSLKIVWKSLKMPGNHWKCFKTHWECNENHRFMVHRCSVCMGLWFRMLPWVGVGIGAVQGDLGDQGKIDFARGSKKYWILKHHWLIFKVFGGLVRGSTLEQILIWFKGFPWWRKKIIENVMKIIENVMKITEL